MHHVVKRNSRTSLQTRIEEMKRDIFWVESAIQTYDTASQTPTSDSETKSQDAIDTKFPPFPSETDEQTPAEAG